MHPHLTHDCRLEHFLQSRSLNKSAQKSAPLYCLQGLGTTFIHGIDYGNEGEVLRTRDVELQIDGLAIEC
jgi:hypothetical protein